MHRQREIKSCFEQSTFNAQEIIPGLFLGSITDLNTPLELEQRYITHLINVTPDNIPPSYSNLNTMTIPIINHPDENIESYFEDAHLKILDCLQKKSSILVYCNSGISGSATIVLSFLMKYGELFHQIPKDKKLNIVTYDIAFDYVRSKREISPNIGFILALNEIDFLRGHLLM